MPAVVLQDPGPTGTMEIEPVDTSGNLTIMNRGKIIARRGAVEDLPGNVQPVRLDTLLSAASLQGVDDTFVMEYFFVEEPAVHFDQSHPRIRVRRLPDQIGRGIPLHRYHEHGGGEHPPGGFLPLRGHECTRHVKGDSYHPREQPEPLE